MEKILVKIIIFLSILLFLISFISIINIIKFAPIEVDAGYYLSYAKEILKGKILLKDLNIRHPFFVIYVYSIIPLSRITKQTGLTNSDSLRYNFKVNN